MAIIMYTVSFIILIAWSALVGYGIYRYYEHKKIKLTVENVRVLEKNPKLSTNIIYGFEVNGRAATMVCSVGFGDPWGMGMYLDTGETMTRELSKLIYDEHLLPFTMAAENKVRLAKHRQAYGYTAENRLLNALITNAPVDEVLKASAAAAEERKQKKS